VVSVFSLAISYLTFVILSRAFPRVAPQMNQLVGIVPATLVNYFLNSYWTFREVGSGDPRARELPLARVD
jgi:dolichol-phosphate mannosyltransferase